MKVLSVKKYNAMKTAKWQADYEQVQREINVGKRNYTELPQLAFYIYNKNYGYVAFNEKRSYWAKTKKAVIEWWNEEEKMRKVRGW